MERCGVSVLEVWRRCRVNVEEVLGNGGTGVGQMWVSLAELWGKFGRRVG